MDHDFHARTFTVAVSSMLVFSGLSTAAYLDTQLCPMDRDGTPLVNHINNDTSRLTSIFDPSFRLFPCHLSDLIVWVYVSCFTIFMGHKYIIYKRLNFHYFLLDFCYFSNFLLCALLMFACFDISNDETRVSNGIPLGYNGYRFDIKPIGVSVSLLSSFARKVYIFIFFALLSASMAVLPAAIYIWNNAMVFHSEDKMTACYLHLAPGVVQVILLHGAMISTANRENSTSKELMKSCFSYAFLLGSHFAMFLAWQVIYHVINETRSYQRRIKVRKLEKRGITPDTGNLSKRVTAYTWMMEKPLGGKTGLPYRFVTMFGMQEWKTKLMFSVTQAMIHFVLLTIGYGPIYLAARYWDVWPMLVYLVFFFIFSIRNAAIILKRWIQKLQREAEQGRKLVEQELNPQGVDNNNNDEEKKKKRKNSQGLSDSDDSDTSSCSSTSSSASFGEEQEREREREESKKNK